MPTLRNIQLIQCSHQKHGSNCRLCGVYMNEFFEAYKTYLYQSDSTITSSRHLRCLKKLKSKFQILDEKFIYSQAIYNFLEKITTKFQFSIQTFALGIYLFNLFLEKRSIQRSNMIEEMEFYSSACLIAGSKSLELDKNIPYLSRYQRYADKSHTKQEYETTQSQIMEQFQFDLQIPTFVTFLNYYLSNGILFENDNFNKNRIFVLQEKVRDIAIKYLRNGSFVTQDQEKLACKIILQARKQCRLKWNPIMEQYTKIPLEQFQQIQILKQINIHHSFTTLPLLNKNIHINRSLKKIHTNRKQIQDKYKDKGLQRSGSMKAIPLVNGLHFKSLNRLQ